MVLELRTRPRAGSGSDHGLMIGSRARNWLSDSGLALGLRFGSRAQDWSSGSGLGLGRAQDRPTSSGLALGLRIGSRDPDRLAGSEPVRGLRIVPATQELQFKHLSLPPIILVNAADVSFLFTQDTSTHDCLLARS
mgnify:CR=1 FL=1